MKFLSALLIVFLLFHDPSGEPIFVARDQIVAVTKNTGGDNRAHSFIITGGIINLFVRETPQEVVSAVEGKSRD